MNVQLRENDNIAYFNNEINDQNSVSMNPDNSIYSPNLTHFIESPKIINNFHQNNIFPLLNKNFHINLNDNFNFTPNEESNNFSLGQMLVNNKNKITKIYEQIEINEKEDVNKGNKEIKKKIKKTRKTKTKKLLNQKPDVANNDTFFKCLSTSNSELSNKNLKGLKMLSIKVKEIVDRHKQTTYKEVSETIIKESDFSKLSKKLRLKEEQNIKRRVYDALNVLISANILIKDNKLVYSNNKYNGNMGISSKNLLIEKIVF